MGRFHQPPLLFSQCPFFIILWPPVSIVASILKERSFFSLSHLYQPSDDLCQFNYDDGDSDGDEEDEGGGEEEEDELEEGSVEERVDAEGEVVRMPRGSSPLPSNHHKVLRLHI